MTITFKNDGDGLNLSRIKDRAVAHGFIQHETALTFETITDLVFRSGFSTARILNDISERGIGPFAVKSFRME